MAKEYDTGLVYNWQCKMNREGYLEYTCEHKHLLIIRTPRTYRITYKGREVGTMDDLNEAFAVAEATIGLMEGGD